MSGKEKAAGAWASILDVMGLKQKQYSIESMIGWIDNVPLPRAKSIQYILLGSGCAVEGLDPDGDFGMYSRDSLRNVYTAVFMAAE